MVSLDEIGKAGSIALKTVKPKGLHLPRFAWAKLNFPSPQLEDIPLRVREELQTIFAAADFRPGMKVAVAVGSRGIADLETIVCSAVAELKQFGLKPFIVPAMGSHGGGTAQGQREVLQGLGISPESTGVPLLTSMQVVSLGETEQGIPLFMDKNAFQADAVLVVNRVREHTDFEGEVQSGLMKMVAIGLGKAAGASVLHERGASELPSNIPAAARNILERVPRVFGLAVVENADIRIATIRAVLPENFEAVDKELLVLAKEITPRLPVDTLDVLVVRYVGKDISGCGMDTKTVGRIGLPGVLEPQRPKIARIAALDLTTASHGNATGLYLADAITQRLASKIDFQAYYLNQLTSSHLEGARLPMVLASDQDTLEVTMGVGWTRHPDVLRAIIIQDTKHLNRLLISEALIAEFEHLPGCEVESEPFPLQFDRQGNLQI